MQTMLLILYLLIANLVPGIAYLLVLIAKKLSYNKKWKSIEKLNQSVGINKYNAYLDDRGYLRWKSTDRLCHRGIVRDMELSKGIHGTNFSDKDVHHKDNNKLNNTPENLEILTREQHQIEHGTLICENGKKYIKMTQNANEIGRETDKAILVGQRWIPKVQIVIKDGFIYREQRHKEHGATIYENGNKYIRIRINTNSTDCRGTNTSIFINGQWFPKAHVLFKDNCIYLPEWLFRMKFRAGTRIKT